MNYRFVFMLTCLVFFSSGFFTWQIENMEKLGPNLAYFFYAKVNSFTMVGTVALGSPIPILYDWRATDLQLKSLQLYTLMAIDHWGFFSVPTYCDTEHPFRWSSPNSRTWHSHLLPSGWQFLKWEGKIMEKFKDQAMRIQTGELQFCILFCS